MFSGATIKDLSNNTAITTNQPTSAIPFDRDSAHGTSTCPLTENYFELVPQADHQLYSTSTYLEIASLILLPITILRTTEQKPT